MVVSAEVLTHTMDENDGASESCAVLGRPVIADELSAVGGGVGKRLGGSHDIRVGGRFVRDRLCRRTAVSARSAETGSPVSNISSATPTLQMLTNRGMSPSAGCIPRRASKVLN